MKPRGMGKSADREILDRALRLGAPQRPRGHAGFTHAVAFDAEVGVGHGELREPRRRPGRALRYHAES